MEINTDVAESMTMKTDSTQDSHISLTVTERGVEPMDSGNLTAGDLEALANIQEELDRLTSVEQPHSDGVTEVTHAMITADGTTVPLTLNPETGQYMTHDGQHIVVSSGGGDDEAVAEDTGVQVLQPDTSDLSSLAAAAVTHIGMGIQMDDQMEVEDQSQDDSQTINLISSGESVSVNNLGGASGVLRILNPDGTLSEIGSLAGDIGGGSGGGIRILNADGSMSALNDTLSSQNIKFVTQDGSMIQLAQAAQEVAQPQQHQSQQLRILNPDGTITVGTPLTVRPSIPASFNQPQVRIVTPEMNQQQPQQIRVINNISGLSPGSFRIITSTGNQLKTSLDGGHQVRVVNASASNAIKSPVRTFSLSQAQQMGVLSGGQGTLKILPKSPQKLSSGNAFRTADGKTIIIGSPQKPQQLMIRPGVKEASQQQQQVIRIPASKVGSSGDFGLQQVSTTGGKVQYVRVITSQNPTISPKTQLVTVRSGVPILPSGLKVTSSAANNVVNVKPLTPGSNKMVKIALPGSQTMTAGAVTLRNAAGPSSVTIVGSGGIKTAAQRIILPSPAPAGNSSDSSSSLVQTKIISLSDLKSPVVDYQTGKEVLDSGDDGKSSAAQFRPIVPSSHATYEAFLSKKEEKPKVGAGAATSSSAMTPATTFEPAGVRPRKPCNCTKSQCLKLYCDCFANGEFCFNCNCNNCFNNLHHERQRQKSIKQCLDRNPSAFRPKIGRALTDGERRHNKGCNCKRSGCLKNYCECYEAKIPCTESCRCVGCKNLEDEVDSIKKESVMPLMNSGGGGVLAGGAVAASAASSSATASMSASATAAHARKSQSLKARLAPFAGGSFRPVDGAKQPFSFVTTEVVEATCQCLLAQAHEAEKQESSEAVVESLIIEEFGRCLKEIIEIAKKSNNQQQQQQQGSGNTSHNH